MKRWQYQVIGWGAGAAILFLMVCGYGIHSFSFMCEKLEKLNTLKTSVLQEQAAHLEKKQWQDKLNKYQAKVEELLNSTSVNPPNRKKLGEILKESSKSVVCQKIQFGPEVILKKYHDHYICQQTIHIDFRASNDQVVSSWHESLQHSFPGVLRIKKLILGHFFQEKVEMIKGEIEWQWRFVRSLS